MKFKCIFPIALLYSLTIGSFAFAGDLEVNCNFKWEVRSHFSGPPYSSTKEFNEQHLVTLKNDGYVEFTVDPQDSPFSKKTYKTNVMLHLDNDGFLELTARHLEYTEDRYNVANKVWAKSESSEVQVGMQIERQSQTSVFGTSTDYSFVCKRIN